MGSNLPSDQQTAKSAEPYTFMKTEWEFPDSILRDLFAAAAKIANPHDHADQHYRDADAMMEARKK